MGDEYNSCIRRQSEVRSDISKEDRPELPCKAYSVLALDPYGHDSLPQGRLI
jgi:hypothetical protein